LLTEISKIGLPIYFYLFFPSVLKIIQVSWMVFKIVSNQKAA